MVQFSYSRPHCGIETVSCLVLQGMAKMEMDCNLKMLGKPFQLLMLCLLMSPNKLFWFVSSDEIL